MGSRLSKRLLRGGEVLSSVRALKTRAGQERERERKKYKLELID